MSVVGIVAQTSGVKYYYSSAAFPSCSGKIQRYSPSATRALRTMNSADALSRATCGIHAGGGVCEHEKLSVIQSDADQGVAYAGVHASTELGGSFSCQKR